MRQRVSRTLLLATVPFVAFLWIGCTRNAPDPSPVIVQSTLQSGPIVWRHFSTRLDPVKAIAMDEDTLWMGTSRGLIRFNTRSGEYQTYTPEDTGGGFVSRGIYMIAVDPAGNKWIGTYGGGLSRFDGQEWRHFSSADGLGDNWIYDIVFDQADRMWVATWSGVSVFDGDSRFTTYTEEDGLADKWVYAIALDHDGIFWFGTEAGVSRFDGTTWTTYTHEDGIGAEIEADPNRIVISPIPSSGSGGEGAYGSPSATHHMDLEKQNIGPNPNFIISALVDQNNHKWFGTWGGGLTRYDGTTWHTYTMEDGLAGNFILSLALDPEGRVWAGTDTGASWFDGTKWHLINDADGLPDNNVFAMLFDKRGHRWFGTLQGLSVFRGSLPS